MGSPFHQCVGSQSSCGCCCCRCRVDDDGDKLLELPSDVSTTGFWTNADLARILLSESSRLSPPASSPTRMVSLMSKWRIKWQQQQQHCLCLFGCLLLLLGLLLLGLSGTLVIIVSSSSSSPAGKDETMGNEALDAKLVVASMGEPIVVFDDEEARLIEACR